jgi:hypothetical protein
VFARRFLLHSLRPHVYVPELLPRVKSHRLFPFASVLNVCPCQPASSYTGVRARAKTGHRLDCLRDRSNRRLDWGR